MTIKIAIILLLTASSFEALKIYPKIIVFDIVDTLWPSWYYTHEPPFMRNETTGLVYDKKGLEVKQYPDVKKIFYYLREKNILISVASRTQHVRDVKYIVKLFGWNRFLVYNQIHTGRKTIHLRSIQLRCNLKYEDFLFFDNAKSNIRDAESLGVLSVLVRKGISMKIVKEGLKKYSDMIEKKLK